MTLIGFIVLLGWAADAPILTRIFPSWIATRANAGFGFALTGPVLWWISTFAQSKGRQTTLPKIASLGALFIIMTLSVMTLLEYLFHCDLHIDQFLFRDTRHITSLVYPGRMPPTTAINFVLISSALILLVERRAIGVAQALAAISAFLTLLVLTGTSYGLEALYSGGHYTAVAAFANLGFCFLSAGALCSSGPDGLMRILTDRGSAGFSVRRLFPTAIAAPIVFGWLSSQGERIGLFGTEMGVSVFSISTIIAFSGLVWWCANLLRRTEEGIHRAEDKLDESLQRYRFLTETVPQIVWTTKADGNVDYFNQRWYDYTGLTTQESIDWGWERVVHPDDLPNCLEHWTRSLDTGCDYEVEYRFKRTDGVYRWYLGRAFPMRNERGEIVQWVGTCTDIDDQKQARRVLEERVAERTQELAGARERLEAVLDAATQVAIIAGNPDTVITVFNSGAERMLGYTASEMIGKKTPAAFHLESEVIARGEELTKELGRPILGVDVFVERARAGKHEEREWTYVRKDGGHLTVNLIITASRNSSGEIIGYVGIAVDVTARKQAEKMLRDQALILDLANDTIFIRDSEDRIIYWNQGAERLYGWSKEEAMGKVTHALFKTQFPQPLNTIEAELFAEGHWEGELIHSRRDGGLVTVASSWTLQRDNANQPVSVIEMNYDITSRKRIEAELKKSRERLDTILNSSLDGVIVYEAVRDDFGKIKDLRFLMINPAAERLMREPASKILGYTILNKFPTARADGLFDKFCHVIETDENEEFEFMSMRSESPRWFRIAGVKLGDGLVISYTEITARKQYERQLEDAKDRAESADRAKGDFLATMSHEIRTPMNGVMGMTGLLLDTRLDAEQRSLAETIRSSSESLLSLINDILDFSKIEAGKLSFEEIDFDLRKVVEDTLEVVAGQAQAKGIELIGGVDPDVITKLRGDPGRVQQLLTNLISNAIKFTPSGEVAIHIMSEVETERGVVAHIEIKDTGIGISPETQARLFQPFVQAESSTSRRFGGTGLGLAICKRLAESMNGSIGVKSRPGEGSTFWVTLRFIRQPHAFDEPEEVPEFINTRVLIVDDNESSRKFLRTQIRTWGLRNGFACEGEEALEVLRRAAADQSPYPVAIIDMQMPEMDGLELAREIHADPALAVTKVILLTPFGKPVSTQELKNATVNASCSKPVRQSALFDCLVQVLIPHAHVPEPPRSEPFVRSEALTPSQKESILLAEDNAVNQRVALGNLSKLGFDADVATSGIEVLEALEGKKYDIILMDCQMPELDGYQTTKEIRRREKSGHRTWIIAMTANVMVGDREKCLAAGMDDYVSKPLRREDLRAALDRSVAKLARPSVQDAMSSLQGEDEEELAELIDLFIGSAPKSIDDMKKALMKKSAPDLTFAAHTLKGSCGNLGKFPLYETCVQMEKAGREGKIEHMAAMVVSAEQDLAEMITALKSRRKA